MFCKDIVVLIVLWLDVFKFKFWNYFLKVELVGWLKNFFLNFLSMLGWFLYVFWIIVFIFLEGSLYGKLVFWIKFGVVVFNKINFFMLYFKCLFIYWMVMVFFIEKFMSV